MLHQVPGYHSFGEQMCTHSYFGLSKRRQSHQRGGCQLLFCCTHRSPMHVEAMSIIVATRRLQPHCRCRCCRPPPAEVVLTSNIRRGSTQHSTQSIAQHSTAQHGTARHGTAQITARNNSQHTRRTGQIDGVLDVESLGCVIRMYWSVLSAQDRNYYAA